MQLPGACPQLRAAPMLFTLTSSCSLSWLHSDQACVNAATDCRCACSYSWHRKGIGVRNVNNQPLIGHTARSMSSQAYTVRSVWHESARQNAIAPECGAPEALVCSCLPRPRTWRSASHARCACTLNACMSTLCRSTLYVYPDLLLVPAAGPVLKWCGGYPPHCFE